MLCMLAGPAGAAGTCDVVRTLIDSKIKSSGVTEYSLTVVEADAKVAGKVVGTCDGDRRKIVYLRGAAPQIGAAASAAASAPRAAAPRQGRDEAIITECKDGTVSRGGDCRK